MITPKTKDFPLLIQFIRIGLILIAMFNTFFSGAYTFLSLFCLVFGLGVSAFGFSVGRDWKDDDFGEEQYRLEKKVYLVITFFTLGLYLKIFLLPLWFFALESLIPFVPGTMCVLGVHFAMGKVGFYATALKFFVPSVYGYWLVLNRLDRKLENQPFMQTKLFSLVPIGLIFSMESLLDFISLSKLSPKPVSCCSSIFDVPSQKIPPIFMETSWFWVILFAGVLLYILYRIAWIKKNGGNVQGSLIAVDTIFIFLSFGFFIMALHTKISPFFLNQPTHHCVFCLWNKEWDVPIASASLFAGIWIYLIFLLISSHKIYELEKNKLRGDILKLLNYSFLLLVSSISVLVVHFFTVLAHFGF